MPKFIVYDADGIVLRRGDASDPLAQAGTNESAIECEFEDGYPLHQRIDPAALAAKGAAIEAARVAIDAANADSAAAVEAQTAALPELAAALSSAASARLAQAAAEAALIAATTDEDRAAAQALIDEAMAFVASADAAAVAAQVPVDAANALAASTATARLAAQTQMDDARAFVVVVDYQPPPPANDADQTWAWNATTKRWLSTPTLAALKRAKWLEIKAQAALSDQADITIGGSVYAADLASRTALFQAAQLATMDATVSLTWQLADGTPIVLTLAQIKAGVRAIGARADAIRAKAITLRATGLAASTPAAVAAIVWSWP